jgi:DNA repair protein RadA/Sms
MAGKTMKDRLKAVLDRELDSQEKKLAQLIEFETRKDYLVLRMPIGVVTLETLWGKIVRLAEANKISVRKADVYATLDELDDVLKDVTWLWKNWIPKGFITLLAGDPGIGKTMIAVEWAKRLSKGEPFPAFGADPLDQLPLVNEPKNCIWVDAEAGQQILRERALALGVNRSNIYIPVVDGDILGAPDFGNEEHKSMIINLILSKRPELLVLDSLGGSNRKGENKVEEVRPLMEFFAMLARDHNIAVVILHHLNKGLGESTEVGLYRIRGSTAIPAFCRSIIAVEKGSTDTELKLRVIKSNLARIPEPLSITSELDAKGNVTKLFYAPYVQPAAKETKKEKCSRWVESRLRENSGDLRLKDLIDSGDALGFTRSMIYAAKDILGDRVTVSGTGREAFWRLTENESDTISISQIQEVMGGEW